MKNLCTFLAAVATSLVMNAETATWSAADLTLSNNDVVNGMTFKVNDNISFTVDKAASDKDCLFRKSSTNPATVIVYSKGTVTFNATDATINSIKFVVNTSEGSSNTPNWSLQTADKTLYNAESDTWTGEETSIVFTDKSAVQITGLEIAYTPEGDTPEVPDVPGTFSTARLFFTESQIATGEAAQNVTLADNDVTVVFTSNSANATIDKSNGYFGTAEDFITLQYRYRAGGKSSNGVESTNKGVMTLPCDGVLTIYAYNNQATARRLQIVQNDANAFEHSFTAEEAVTPEGSEKKVYPVYTAELKKGTAYVLWPDNQLMLFGFMFEPDNTSTGVEDITVTETPVDAPAYDLMGRRVSDDYKGFVIQGGKKYLRR